MPKEPPKKKNCKLRGSQFGGEISFFIEFETWLNVMVYKNFEIKEIFLATVCNSKGCVTLSSNL